MHQSQRENTELSQKKWKREKTHAVVSSMKIWLGSVIAE